MKFIRILACFSLSALLLACSFQEKHRVKLVYMRWANPAEEETVKTLIASFMKKYPDIKVKVITLPWTAYWDKLQTMSASGEAPDVFLMSGAMLYDFYKKNILLDLSPFVKEVNLDDFFELPVKIFTVKGKLIGLPRDCNVVALFYNVDIFNEYSVEPPSPGWTWEDFLKTARKLTIDTNSDGKPDIYGFQVLNWFEGCWGPFLWQAGGSVLSKDRRRCVLNSGAGLEAFSFLHSLIYRWRVAPTPIAQESLGGDLFRTGHVAMTLDGSWKVKVYNDAGLNWDVAHPPRHKFRATSVNGTANVIWAKTKHPREAWLLVKFLSGLEAQRMLAGLGTSIPVRKSVAYSDYFLKGSPPHKKIFLEAMSYGHDLEFTPGWLQWTDKLRQILDLLWLDKISVEEALKKATSEVNAVLERSF